MVPSPSDAGEALNNEFGLLMARLLEFVNDDLSPYAINAAWLDFNNGEDSEMDPESPEVLDFFFPWMLLNWSAELPERIVKQFRSTHNGLDVSKDTLARFYRHLDAEQSSDGAFDDGLLGDEPVVVIPPVGQMFLACIDGLDDADAKYASQTVSEGERSLIEQAGMAPYSFFQVKETVGSYVKLKDLLVPADHFVFAPHLTDSLERGGVFYGQVVSVKGVAIVISIAPVMLSADTTEPLSHVRDRVMEMVPGLGSDWRHAMAGQLRGLYRSMAGDDDRGQAPSDDVAQNLSKPVLTILRYQLPGNLERNLEALAHLSGNTAEELLCTVETFTEADDIEGEGVHFQWMDDDDDGDDQSLRLGEIRISKDEFVAHLVGQGSAQIIEQEIAKHMGTKARLLERKVMTVGDMRKEMAKQQVSKQVSRRGQPGKGRLH